MWKDVLSLRVCTVALPPPPPPPPPANIWSICCISCCWAAFVPALLGEEAGFSVGMPPAVGMPGTPPVGMPGTPPVGMPGTPPDIKLSQKGKKKLKNNFYKKNAICQYLWEQTWAWGLALLSAVSVNPVGSALELAWPGDWSWLTGLLGSASVTKQRVTIESQSTNQQSV